MAKTERVVETITAYADATVPLLVYYKDAYQAAAFASTSSGSVSVGGSTSNQQRIRDFVPAATDTLVVDGAEKGAVAGLTNWRGMYQKADGTFDDAARDADRFFADPLHPGMRVYSGGGYRPAASLNKIALHETAGSRDLLHVSDFRVATWRDSGGVQHSYRPMAHFCIDRDGTIRQFLDVCELAITCRP